MFLFLLQPWGVNKLNLFIYMKIFMSKLLGDSPSCVYLCMCVLQETKGLSAGDMWNKKKRKRNKFRCLQEQPQPCFVWLTFIPCAKSECRFLTVNLFIRTKIGSVIGTQLHTQQTNKAKNQKYIFIKTERKMFLFVLKGK